MLYSAPDIEREPESITAILVNPAEKKRFDEIYLTLEKSKKSLVSRLNRKSGIAKDEIEQVLLSDFDATDLFSLLSGLGLSGDAESSGFKYQDILSEDSLEILQSAVFIESARAFGEAYGDIFEQERSPFKRGVFNPAKADAAISGLSRHGYFDGGHRVHFDGDEFSLTGDEVEARLAEIQSKIEGDERLSALKKQLGGNAKKQKLNDLLEQMSLHQLDVSLRRFALRTCRDSVSSCGPPIWGKTRGLWTYSIIIGSINLNLERLRGVRRK